MGEETHAEQSEGSFSHVICNRGQVWLGSGSDAVSLPFFDKGNRGFSDDFLSISVYCSFPP